MLDIIDKRSLSLQHYELLYNMLYINPKKRFTIKEVKEYIINMD